MPITIHKRALARVSSAMQKATGKTAAYKHVAVAQKGTFGKVTGQVTPPVATNGSGWRGTSGYDYTPAKAPVAVSGLGAVNAASGSPGNATGH